VIKMNKLTGEKLLDIEDVRRQVEARDREIDNTFTKDLQLTAMHGARNYVGDKLLRTVKPHRFLDAKNGPLIAVKLHILSRKTLGRSQSQLRGHVFGVDRKVMHGLYAAGEASGFGGRGLHGHRSLEGTFLCGCLLTGKKAVVGVLGRSR